MARSERRAFRSGDCLVLVVRATLRVACGKLSSCGRLSRLACLPKRTATRLYRVLQRSARTAFFSVKEESYFSLQLTTRASFQRLSRS